MPRFYCPQALAAGSSLELPPGAARHVQVLRLQPGAEVTLFDGAGGEYAATVERMGRSEVVVRVGAHTRSERESPRRIELAIGMPANDRMDWLVEKATELGVASISPLETRRGVLRLQGERVRRKREHWQGIAASACEQCGRNTLPAIGEITRFETWLADLAPGAQRCVLSLGEEAKPLRDAAGNAAHVIVLAGPEGGLDPEEEAAALRAGFQAVTLGARVLRSETAAIAAVAILA